MERLGRVRGRGGGTGEVMRPTNLGGLGESDGEGGEKGGCSEKRTMPHSYPIIPQTHHPPGATQLSRPF
eukprot:scaffold11629_cov131-Isochrysis_galbana.AAC.2